MQDRETALKAWRDAISREAVWTESSGRWAEQVIEAGNALTELTLIGDQEAFVAGRMWGLGDMSEEKHRQFREKAVAEWRQYRGASEDAPTPRDTHQPGVNVLPVDGTEMDESSPVAPPQEPTGASPQAEASEDEDDVPSVDSWSAPLRKPVVPKILSTDDFYALLRILEVLPVADPFLTDLQAKLSDEERRQHGNRASHLSGPEFVREIERIEALIQSRLPAHVSPVDPTPEPETPADPLAPRKPVVNLMDALRKSLESLDRTTKVPSEETPR